MKLCHVIRFVLKQRATLYNITVTQTHIYLMLLVSICYVFTYLEHISTCDYQKRSICKEFLNKSPSATVYKSLYSTQTNQVNI